LISSDLRDRLVAAISPLENFPDGEKDWHPGSDNQILDPSLYPVVYDRTLVKDPQTGKCDVLEPPYQPGHASSHKFQWLPSDFVVAEGGTVTLFSPYINNVHPQKHATLQSVIPKLLERAVPLWERVLSDLRRLLLPFRTKSAVEGSPPDCVDPKVDPSQEDDDLYDTDIDAWLSRSCRELPDAKEKYTGDLDVMKAPTVSLKGTTIQCIIKLANIVLTPEEPEYPGGKWHVEGQWIITPVFFGRSCSRTYRRDGKRTHCFQFHICKPSV